MIRMVQLGIAHPHAAAYRETLRALDHRIELVGLLADPLETMPEPEDSRSAIPIFHSLEDLLDNVTFDAAQVMLRNDEMGDALVMLAGHGIHLWVEKPVARRAADLAPLPRLLSDQRLVFTSGYQSRFYPANQYVKAMISEGLLGPLTFAHMTTATTTAALRRPDGPLGYLFDPGISGGGVFHWLGCHMVDILLYLTGARPATVTATMANTGEARLAVEDVAVVALTFPDGWVASLNYGYLLPTATPAPWGDDGPEPALYGQHGWVRWSTIGDVARSWSSHPRRSATPWHLERFDLPSAPGYGHAALLAMTNFIDAIEGYAEPAYSIDEAITVLRVIEGAYESANTGRTIRLDDPEGAAPCDS